MPRRWWALVVVAVLPAARPAWAQDAPLDSIQLEQQVREVASRLRCPVCLNLSIQDSPSELARDMRNIVRDRLRRGETEAQIQQFFEERYGEWVNMQPRARGVNLLVWLLPAAALIGGGLLVVLAVRRWMANAALAAGAGDDQPVSEEYLRKVEQELEGNQRD